ncbi:hypothetical protein CONPUDRAFT_78064 [Coniophora puteana RWD-64-598 SS2]|uniref:Uncharacterized protein n=1 Tax=Coniophora puteana (strain RWD-64-598) TaxID=741705 RepID=R7SE16_CONPW|nr:uncharacterized protein CONPUDRAFT_78064 [Coniophora puteana RWD-64-598 SS2]EIW74413.1 hypothetical protein CONPUDRAFT_78064 [Coniophora puteana RWD-64-598 SS2]
MSADFSQTQQTLNYGNVVYFDQERRDESMPSKCLYATMRYCGLLYAIYGVGEVPIGQWGVSSHSWYGICYSGIVITIATNYAVAIALDAMMTLRVYALYGQSKVVIVVLSVFFVLSQGVVFVSQFIPYVPQKRHNTMPTRTISYAQPAAFPAIRTQP